MKKLSASILLALFAQFASAEMILKRGNGTEPKTIDPSIAEGVPENNLIMDLFEGLISEDADANLIPGIAESWEVSADGKEYTFKLRPSVWSDGTAFTAHDFVYSWQRTLNPATGSNYASILYPIKNAQAINEGKITDLNELGAKAIDDLTLKVELEGPIPYFLGLLAHHSSYPAPKHIVEKHGNNWTRPENMVSNGAFKMESWVPNSQIVLVKSDNYWDKEQVKLDKVIFYPIEDQNSELKRYRSGEIDVTNEIPNDQIKWLKENLSNELHIGAYLGTYYYGLNVGKPPFKDNPKLREALSLAIDRDILTEKVTGVGEIPAYNFVPKGINGYEAYQPEAAKLSKEERLKKAQALYAEAGYSKDKPLKTEILYNTSENHKKIAIAVASMWKQNLGVETSLSNQEWKVYLETRRLKEKTQAFRAGWIGDYNDPNTFLEMFKSNSGLNDVALNLPEFDQLLADAEKESNPEKRFELLKQADKLLVESYAVLPLYTYVKAHLVKPYVKGFKNNIMDHNRSKYISIEK